MSANAQQGNIDPQYCPSCGLLLEPAAQFCGSCGRPVAATPAPTVLPSALGQWPTGQPPLAPPPALAGQGPHATLPAAASGWPASSELYSDPGSEPTWPAAGAAVPMIAPTAPVGMAALASGPVAGAPAGRSRRGLLASIAALCVVALLGASAYWVFASFLHPGVQTQDARYLPDTTLAYVSIDLAAAANNTHHLTPADLAQNADFASAALKATGLDPQHDVLPWLGPAMTVGVFPVQLAGASGSGTGMSSPVQTVVLLQSHDDTAAGQAVQKAIAFQQQNGATLTTSTYGGYTLHTATGGQGADSTLATGSGLVILASSLDGAHTVIDRANGQGATLSGASAFQQVVAGLPSDRFGTIYVNVRGVTDPLGTGTSVVHVPFLDTYPTGGGALIWTSAGLRWQTTFTPAKGGVPQGTLGGDTTGLAALVPGTAAVYVGAANSALLIQQAVNLTTPANQQSTDPVQSALGVPSTDPALQHPSAFFVLAPASASSQGAAATGAFLLRAPDASAASNLLAKIAQHNNWTSQATTVDGVSATTFYGSADGSGTNFSVGPVPTIMPLVPPQAQGAPSATSAVTIWSVATQSVATQSVATQSLAARPVAVAATVNGTLVVASDADALTAVVGTAHGTQASLAQASHFQQLTTAAPTGAAAIAYLDMAGLQRLEGSSKAVNVYDPTSHATASLLTLVWDTTQLQATYDVALDQ